jgi:hypothetical protein
MLHWTEEGVPALIGSPEKAEWVTTSLSSAERTIANRDGVFELTEDGTLVGRVEQSFSGHMGLEHKRTYDGLTVEERAQRVTDTVTGRFPGAEVSDVSVVHADDLEGLFGYSYSIRIPGYAAVTGQRMFVQPNYFQKNATPRFLLNEREHAVYFDYPWSEVDKYAIRLPEGFTLENPTSRRPLDVPDIGSYGVRLTDQDGKKIVYEREFQWGTGGVILFQKSAYPQLKVAFDFMHLQDQHMLIARRDTEAVSQ